MEQYLFSICKRECLMIVYILGIPVMVVFSCIVVSFGSCPIID